MILELGLLLAIQTSYCLGPVASPLLPNRFISALSATLHLHKFEIFNTCKYHQAMTGKDYE